MVFLHFWHVHVYLKALFNNVFTFKNLSFMARMSLVRCENEALENCTSKASMSAS